ncbi:15652_t:CDS:2 [Cetraspora pellucida]|uniref:15652_t:CDS:1 n=1 Tax=Cetraspora pellucida TaxID=1433469 RepID=A0ACA9MBE2_9GLOM|nr:15652_t:CDS:2 [Cetraspora pellucida]
MYGAFIVKQEPTSLASTYIGIKKEKEGLARKESARDAINIDRHHRDGIKNENEVFRRPSRIVEEKSELEEALNIEIEVEKDDSKKLEWYSKKAKEESAYAKEEAPNIEIEVKKDNPKACEWYLKKKDPAGLNNEQIRIDHQWLNDIKPTTEGTNENKEFEAPNRNCHKIVNIKEDKNEIRVKKDKCKAL